MRKYTFLILTLCILKSFGATIIVDPGHGGNDLGAKFHGSKSSIYEKDIVLKLALKLEENLKKNHKVFLTRKTDEFINLEKRAELASKHEANLFISLHANYHNNSKASGVEIFYLSQHDDEAVQKLERIENKHLEEKNKDIVTILADLMIQETAPKSKSLAAELNNELEKNTIRIHKIKNRGIKPAVFHVLSLAKVPAVLIEIGFLSNSLDRKKLKSDKYLSNFVKDIKRAIKKFEAKNKKDDNISLL